MIKRPREKNLANPIGRSTPEWIGATADTKVPPHVQLRVLLRYDRKCYLTGQPIRGGDKFEMEHIIALSNGGENRESNLAPALVEPHKDKTARDRAEKAKVDRIAKKHHGLRKASRPMMGSKASGWRKRLDGTVERR